MPNRVPAIQCPRCAMLGGSPWVSAVMPIPLAATMYEDYLLDPNNPDMRGMALQLGLLKDKYKGWCLVQFVYCGNCGYLASATPVEKLSASEDEITYKRAVEMLSGTSGS